MAGVTLRAMEIAPGRDWAAGKYLLRFTGSGNLEVWNNGSRKLLWQSGTVGRNAAKLAMQVDGNLVIYDTGQKAIWASGTDNNPSAYLAMQEDGNLVIYSRDNRPLWNTATVGK